MWNRYKILLLPILVYLFGGISLLIGDTPVYRDHNVAKGFPFLPDQSTKTEWKVPSQPAKVSRSYAPVIFTPQFTEIRISFFILPKIEKEVFYSFIYYTNNKGRSPPFLSC